MTTMPYLRAFLIPFFLSAPASAQEIELAFPVDCTLEETCVIQQTMDHDTGPSATDFRCGPMTYDSHRGTDIRVADREAMDLGVAILAAAEGTVLGVRDRIPDVGIGGAPEGQDCGNGVLIDHANGWQTQYCHMAQGSVTVRTGDTVDAGQTLGLMGFSGTTTFPHLHFSVRRNGTDIDPFDPSETQTCGADAAPLWADDLPMRAGGILSAGFAAAVPEFAAIRAGTADAQSLSTTQDALVLWGFIYSGRAGDIVTLSITEPSGADFHTQIITLERTQAELFRASGRRLRAPLQPGTYVGTVTLTRDGTVIDATTISIPTQ